MDFSWEVTQVQSDPVDATTGLLGGKNGVFRDDRCKPIGREVHAYA